MSYLVYQVRLSDISPASARTPNTSIVVRAGYHVHRWQLEMAGADAVVDEEEEVGIQIAAEVRDRIIGRQA